MKVATVPAGFQLAFRYAWQTTVTTRTNASPAELFEAGPAQIVHPGRPDIYITFTRSTEKQSWFYGTRHKRSEWNAAAARWLALGRRAHCWTICKH
jgi:hypothetical protein